MKRRDGLSVFEEGENFSGAERQGLAEASISTVAASYMPPRFARDAVVSAAESVTQRKPKLPEGLKEVEALPPHLIVWWRSKDGADDGRADITTLPLLPKHEQQNVSQVIERQVRRGARILYNLTGRLPVIEGSWGYATPEQRVVEGRSAGGPSNRHGHLHLLDFDPNDGNVEFQNNLDASDRLNHYAPWNALIHRSFSQPLGRVISEYFGDCLRDTDVEVEPFSETMCFDDGRTAYNDGYDLTFRSPISFDEVFSALTGLNEKFDSFYRDIGKLYELAFKHGAHFSEAQAAIEAQALHVGFGENEAMEFADFALKVRPTYSQLLKWQSELDASSEDYTRVTDMVERYERCRKWLGQATRSLAGTLLKDTLASPDEGHEPISAWPVHISGVYVVKKYDMNSGDLQVHQLRVIPLIGTNETAERIRGGIFKRSRG
jgi:hypothetical protein